MNPSSGFFAEVAIHVFWVHTRATVLDKFRSSMQCNCQKEARVNPALRSFLEFRISGFRTGAVVSQTTTNASPQQASLSPTMIAVIYVAGPGSGCGYETIITTQNFPKTALVPSGLCLVSYERYEKAFFEQRH